MSDELRVGCSTQIVVALVMKLRGLEALRHSLIGVERGTWWVLYESLTEWSETRTCHPWIVTYASARTAFYHGAPRSRSADPGNVRHAKHLAGHEPGCFLDSDGWIVAKATRQLESGWFDPPNWYSCTEPDGSDLLDQIDAARRGVV